MYMRKKYREWGLESDGWDRAIDYLKNGLLVVLSAAVIYAFCVMFLAM